MDIPSVRYPLCQENTTGVTSTHGLDIAGREMAIGQNHNKYPPDVYAIQSRQPEVGDAE